MLGGAALLEQGAVDEAIACIREDVTEWAKLGRALFSAYGLASLAEGLTRRGDRPAALAALREGCKHRISRASICGMRNYTALPGRCCSPKTSSARARSASRKPNKRNRWNCAPRRASRGCGANGADGAKPATCDELEVDTLCQRLRRLSLVVR